MGNVSKMVEKQWFMPISRSRYSQISQRIYCNSLMCRRCITERCSLRHGRRDSSAAAAATTAATILRAVLQQLGECPGKL